MSPEAHAAPQDVVPRVPRTIFEHAHIDGNALFPTSLDVSRIGEVFLHIPDNWNGFDAVRLWFIGGETSALAVDVTIDGATDGELTNTHTQTVNNIVGAMVANTYEVIDITADFAVVLALIAANDMMWFKVDEDTGVNLLFVGVEIQES